MPTIMVTYHLLCREGEACRFLDRLAAYDGVRVSDTSVAVPAGGDPLLSACRLYGDLRPLLSERDMLSVRLVGKAKERETAGRYLPRTRAPGGAKPRVRREKCSTASPSASSRQA